MDFNDSNILIPSFEIKVLSYNIHHCKTLKISLQQIIFFSLYLVILKIVLHKTYLARSLNIFTNLSIDINVST